MAFQCPICSHKKYDVFMSLKGVDNDPGPKYTMYVCPRCSALFADPQKFYRGGKSLPYTAPVDSLG